MCHLAISHAADANAASPTRMSGRARQRIRHIEHVLTVDEQSAGHPELRPLEEKRAVLREALHAEVVEVCHEETPVRVDVHAMRHDEPTGAEARHDDARGGKLEDGRKGRVGAGIAPAPLAHPDGPAVAAMSIALMAPHVRPAGSVPQGPVILYGFGGADPAGC